MTIFRNKVVQINDVYASLFGFDSVTELGDYTSSPLKLISEEIYKKVAQLSTSSSLSLDCLDPNGELCLCSNQSGKTIALFVVMQKTLWKDKPALEVLLFDISTKVSPHQLINRTRYESLVKNSEQGVVIHRYFKPLLMNQVWADLMGVKEQQEFLDNGSVFDVIPNELHARSLERCEKVLNGESVGESHIIENIRLDGKKRYFNVYDHAINWEGEPALEVIVADVTDKVLAQKELAYRAAHDSLTGLLNRDALYKWIKEHCNGIKSMACLLIDIDNFKNINDNYGHQVGDSVLKNLSLLIKKQVNEQGVVGRWGGEEFIIFLPELSKTECYDVAEQIRLACENSILSSQFGSIRNTISVGVSFTDNAANTMPKDLIRVADEKMYLSKLAGKNQVN